MLKFSISSHFPKMLSLLHVNNAPKSMDQTVTPPPKSCCDPTVCDGINIILSIFQLKLESMISFGLFVGS